MFRRRRRGEQPRGSGDESAASGSGGAAPADPTGPDSGEASSKDPRTNGPYDASEVDLDDARAGRLDLGGLLVKVEPGMKVQLQVDQRTGRAASVVLATENAAVQLVAVAAPRSSGLWEQTRLQIAADVRRRGGVSEEGAGPFGVEVRLAVPVQAKDGRKLVQRSRISGIDGPRWMLRATFHGAALTDAAVLKQLADLVRQTVVVRGGHPMPPGDVIVLTPPQGNQPIETAPADTGGTGDLDGGGTAGNGADPAGPPA